MVAQTTESSRPAWRGGLLLLCGLLGSACAAADVSSEPRPVPAQSPPATGAAATPEPQIADLESTLAAYEAQLASNEVRLRAMGVLVASRDVATAEEAPGRFAPPPAPVAGTPSRPADGAEAQPQTKSARKQDSATDRKRASRPSGAGPSPAPAPRQDLGGSAGDASRRAESRPKAKAPESDDEAFAARTDDADRGRCVELCDLADSTCDLEGKICDLASRHPGDPRYAEVCRRADADCRIAAEACTVCSP